MRCSWGPTPAPLSTATEMIAKQYGTYPARRLSFARAPFRIPTGGHCPLSRVRSRPHGRAASTSDGTGASQTETGTVQVVPGVKADEEGFQLDAVRRLRRNRGLPGVPGQGSRRREAELRTVLEILALTVAVIALAVAV